MIHTGVESALKTGTVRASLASTVRVLSLFLGTKLIRRYASFSDFFAAP